MEEGFYHGESVRVWVWMRVLGDEDQQSSSNSTDCTDWGWWRRDSTTVSL